MGKKEFQKQNSSANKITQPMQGKDCNKKFKVEISDQNSIMVIPRARWI